MGLNRAAQPQPLRIKICGLTTAEAVEAAVEENTDFYGFIFYALSPRNITPTKADTISVSIPAEKRKVAVFVDPSLDDIRNVLASFKPNYIQLHGSETTDFISRVKADFGLPIIKAIAVGNVQDLDRTQDYASIADMLLFDTKTPSGASGGTGQSFDWSLLKGRAFPLPWFISGGINAQNVQEALDISGAKYVDVSSSLERERGIKDPAKIRAFLTQVESRRK